MQTIKETLQNADPLRHEQLIGLQEHEFFRQQILKAVSNIGTPITSASRSRVPILAFALLILICGSIFGLRVWSPFVGEMQAAVRFEIRLAENNSSPGLQEAKVAGSDRSVYLHHEPVVVNGDVAAAQVIRGTRPSQYAVSIQLNSSGAKKMLAASANHVGRPVAILIDGQIVAAPVVRTPVGGSAMITGSFTEKQAKRIAAGITVR